MNLEKMLSQKEITRSDLTYLMKLKSQSKLDKLYRAAYKVKAEHVGPKVYYRGLIEFSNQCQKNCFYCGIRKDNQQVQRFTISEKEILAAARWAHENNYGSLVLQSGELQNEEFIDFVEKIIKKIKKLSQNELGITLSLGEQKKETYQRWFAAGAHRYLLRIESSKQELYQQLHPEEHSFKRRLQCLKNLKELGYQVGSGVMIGLPGQSIEDLVEDLLFFKQFSIDMVGMGPYVLHPHTPLARSIDKEDSLKQRNLKWSLKMIALLRLLMPDINIAATTALQALDPVGREKALQAGANVIMPIITPQKYRLDYQLYEDKPCVDEKASDCKDCLEARINSVGDEIAYGEWGDSPHYFKRIQHKRTGGTTNAKDTPSQ
ncbi:[FeFe] hydrogenase H-cluster radical SAM maturase HydE [Fuchsiella alkaliacetigena]|uniref:[FeFe] hydrogenase H-cluster radical SAM maturase HydE n=1 Tax=Fuchsiella alkaliacetigena TaxID=957042 RepID=UPI002009F650|nr:[FeFe] hydrogenase H-cluster radical SAM maturase HydE [Fuchsiella alkaliacetigena]MCK8825759.1 [FeFe] hydrogenase H-cluster radical SAM maturase HydE [Fuchsiella alkaliacetigena]